MVRTTTASKLSRAHSPMTVTTIINTGQVCGRRAGSNIIIRGDNCRIICGTGGPTGFEATGAPVATVIILPGQVVWTISSGATMTTYFSIAHTATTHTMEFHERCTCHFLRYVYTDRG